MSKKILMAFSPIAAIVALMAIPAIAQATQLQINGKEAANGAPISAQSTDLALKIEDSAGKALDEFKCSHSEFNGKVTQNQGTHGVAQIEEGKFKNNCVSALGFDIDMSINAPWVVQIQKPDAGGKFIAHIEPDPGHTATVQFRAQLQSLGTSIATCDYTAPTVQANGVEKTSNVLTLEGTQQFTLASGAVELCGEKGTLVGTLKVTGKGNPFGVDAV
jgi:hypothetical protein